MTNGQTPDAMRTSLIPWPVVLTSAIAAPDLHPRPAQAVPLPRAPVNADSFRHRSPKRDDASQKIDQVENQVMSKAQEIETKVVGDKGQQVKAQVDWRHQVEERPLLAVGAALVGITDRTFPGMLDKVQSAADSVSSAGKETPSAYADGSRTSSTMTG